MGRAIVAAPRDNEAAVRGHCDRGLLLLAGGGDADVEFAADLGAGGIEALPIDPGRIAVLTIARPHDDKFA